MKTPDKKFKDPVILHATGGLYFDTEREAMQEAEKVLAGLLDFKKFKDSEKNLYIEIINKNQTHH